MPRQTHPRTVASMKPPGTQILRKIERDFEDKRLMAILLKSLSVNEKNAVQQRKVTNVIDSRSM